MDQQGKSPYPTVPIQYRSEEPGKIDWAKRVQEHADWLAFFQTNERFRPYPPHCKYLVLINGRPGVGKMAISESLIPLIWPDTDPAVDHWKDWQRHPEASFPKRDEMQSFFLGKIGEMLPKLTKFHSFLIPSGRPV